MTVVPMPDVLTQKTKPPKAPKKKAKSPTDKITDRHQRAHSLARERIMKGERIFDRDTCHEEFGFSHATMDAIVKAERLRVDIMEELDIDPTTLSPSAKAKLESAKNRIQKRLLADYNARLTKVDEEVRQRVVAGNKAYLDRLKEREADVERQETVCRMLRNNHKPLFTTAEFRTILMCLHPDGERTKDKLAEAFRLLNGKKLQLTGET